MERWKINLYILWVTQVLSLMSFGLFAPYIPLYLRELGMTDPDGVNLWTGLLSFTPAAAMVISSPLWGVMSDRFGKKMMLVRAMACATAIIAGMAFVTNHWQLLILRALQGFFTGTVTASMAFVSTYTPENRISYALGLLSSSNFIGYSIGPVVGGLFVETLGLRPCFLSAAVSMAAGLVLAVVCLKEEPVLTASCAASGSQPSEKKRASGQKPDYKRLLSLSIVLCLLMLFTTRMIRSLLGPYMTLFVEELLGTTQGAASWTGIINGVVCIVSAAATLTLVRLGDRHSKMKLLALMTLFTLPFALFSALASTLLVFLLAFTLFNFFSGALEPLLTSGASENAPPEMRGTLFGIVGMVNNAGFMLAPMLGSYISIRFSLQGILFLIPAFTALQLGISLIAVKKEKAFTNRP